MRVFILLSLVALVAASVPGGMTVNKRGQLISRQDVSTLGFRVSPRLLSSTGHSAALTLPVADALM